MRTNRVVTISLNPALDLTGSLDRLQAGSVSLVKKGTLHAAGKGVNVAKVLSELGAEVTVTGFLGRDNQEMFCQLFQELGVKDRFVRVDGATRINVKLVEHDGKVSDINFPGVNVTAQAISDFERELYALAESHDYFVIAGSLPNGISPQLCAKWIKTLSQQGKKVLFDSSREALAVGLDASPWMIKPNDEELSHFVGAELKNAEQCQNAATSLVNKGVSNVVVSMGEKGVMWVNSHMSLRSTPPKMDVISTVGAGDTLVAGLCWGHMQEMENTEVLRFATALSAMAVSQVGVGVSSMNEVQNLKNLVQLSELDPL